MAKTAKLPKHIAGVKIPKKLRKRGGKAYALLQNPLVADIVAAGLIAAANAMAKSKPVKKAGKAAKHAAKDAGEATTSAGAHPICRHRRWQACADRTERARA